MSNRDLSRRHFLQAVAASSVTAVLFAGCAIPPHELQEQSRLLQPEDLAAASEDWYATICRMCPAGCGMLARVVDGRVRKVEGNPESPVNRGKLCARGQASVQLEYHPDRITGPLLRNGPRGSGQWLPIDWNEGLDRLGSALSASPQGAVAWLTRPMRGHDALVLDRFTRTSGAQWLTEPSHTEPALRAAMQRVFGQPQLPTFDIANAHYVLAFGADFLDTWVAPVHYGVAYGIFRQGEYSAGPAFNPGSTRGTLVYAGPHFSATAASADEWIYTRPGTEGMLAASLAQTLITEGLADQGGTSLYGGAGALTAYAPDKVADQIGVDADRIRQLARSLASNRPALVLGGDSVASQSNGTEALSAVLGLNLLLGNVGQTGGVLLAPASPFGELPQAPISSLADWQQLTNKLETAQITTLIVHGANPVYALPAGVRIADALQHAQTIISLSSMPDETTELADLVLPTHLPLEDWGDDVPEITRGIPTVSFQQPVVQPLHDTRGFVDLLLTVAAELGGSLQQALPWPTYRDLLREAASQLSQVDNGSIPKNANLDQYWTSLLQHGVWTSSTTPAASVTSNQQPIGLSAAQFTGDAQTYPFVLLPFAHNTLTGGDAASLPWLQAAPDPVTSAVWRTWVAINPDLASRMGLAEGDIVRLESPIGQLELPVYVSPAASPEVLAVPLGQGHTAGGRWARNRGVNPLAIIAPVQDGSSGGLASGATRVRMLRTGGHVPLPKLEGDVPAYQLPGKEVLKVTNA